MNFAWKITVDEPFESLKKPLVSGQHFRADDYGHEIVFVYGSGIYKMTSFENISLIEGSAPMDIHEFFDLDRNYDAIEIFLKNLDGHMAKAVELFSGLRILQQDTFEMLLTFIVSQSKQIPQIKILVERLCELYGDFIGAYKEKSYYSFPTPSQLAAVDESVYRALKTGYRGPYLADAVEKVLTGQVDFDAIKSMTYGDAKEMLKRIKGVGDKVADCVLLYGCGNFMAFPVDVWIERTISHLYFNGQVTKQEMQSFISTYFGGMGGIAQQYLFEYGRMKAKAL